MEVRHCLLGEEDVAGAGMKDCLADFKEEDARHGSYGGILFFIVVRQNVLIFYGN